MELVPKIEIEVHTQNKENHYFRYFEKNCFGLTLFIKPVKDKRDLDVEGAVKKIIDEYLDSLEVEENRKNPVVKVIGFLNKINKAIIERGVDYPYDFVLILCYKGYIFVFGSGAFPVVLLYTRGIRESIMLDGFKVSEKDYPLYRLGTLKDVSSERLLFDVERSLPPFKIVISDRDVSHIMRIIDLPILFGLQSKNFHRRLLAETLSVDKEDVDLITLCA